MPDRTLSVSFSGPLLPLYQKAMNEIDDYFEYRYRTASNADIKKFVDSVLDRLAKSISTVAESNV